MIKHVKFAIAAAIASSVLFFGANGASAMPSVEKQLLAPSSSIESVHRRRGGWGWRHHHRHHWRHHYWRRHHPGWGYGGWGGWGHRGYW